MPTTPGDPERVTDFSDAGDPFHDPVLGGIGIAVVFVCVAILLLTGLIHWGVEYRTPPWNANSYPPPVVHRW
jgi:hypothetical protein